MELSSQFNKHYPRIKAISNRYSRGTSIPAEDFESEFCEVYYQKFDAYDKSRCDNFEAFVFLEIKKRAIEVIRSKYGKSWQRFDYLEEKLSIDCEGMNAVDVLVIADGSTESSAIERVMGDKRQLIQSLLDETTTPIVEDLLATGDSINQVGKRFGLHPETTFRKLRKLRKRFDEKRFGDITDYLVS